MISSYPLLAPLLQKGISSNLHVYGYECNGALVKTSQNYALVDLNKESTRLLFAFPCSRIASISSSILFKNRVLSHSGFHPILVAVSETMFALDTRLDGFQYEGKEIPTQDSKEHAHIVPGVPVPLLQLLY